MLAGPLAGLRKHRLDLLFLFLPDSAGKCLHRPALSGWHRQAPTSSGHLR
jgi:hypothetical protein